LLAIGAGEHGESVRLNSRGLFNRWRETASRGWADQRQTDPISAKAVPRYHQRKHDVRSLSFNCPITIP
jgi:hypothetical protein